MNPKHNHAPIAANPQRKRCPICHQSVYFACGHPSAMRYGSSRSAETQNQETRALGSGRRDGRRLIFATRSYNKLTGQNANGSVPAALVAPRVEPFSERLDFQKPRFRRPRE